MADVGFWRAALELTKMGARAVADGELGRMRKRLAGLPVRATTAVVAKSVALTGWTTLRGPTRL